jgi:hypothetical protein
MPETFLILLAGGVMLAAALSDPRQVSQTWMRLCGRIALALTALAFFSWVRREETVHAGQIASWVIITAMFAGPLAFVQKEARLQVERFSAAIAFVVAVWAGMAILPRDVSLRPTTPLALGGVAAMTGLVLMDMLLGHAYLTASQMTQRPFARLNFALAIVLLLRAILAGGVAPWMQHVRPIPMFWASWGIILGTRYLVGLIVPALFIYMAHDCIRRRANQSATGILYVAGILVMIGELTGLYLVKQTGLPF